MRRLLIPTSAVAVLLMAVGCGNKWEDMLSRVDGIMKEKIENGEIKNEKELRQAEKQAEAQVMKEMGLKKSELEDVSEDDMKDLEKLYDEYKKEWKRLLKEKSGQN